MQLPTPTAIFSFADIVAPLSSVFGDAVSIQREGKRVRWAYAGQSAVVELLADGTMQATFLDREDTDAVSKQPATAAYRAGSSYRLNTASSARMVGDMIDFFSGVREPKFTFCGAYSR